jgi:hypothetical protein
MLGAAQMLAVILSRNDEKQKLYRQLVVEPDQAIVFDDSAAVPDANLNRANKPPNARGLPPCFSHGECPVE